MLCTCVKKYELNLWEHMYGYYVLKCRELNVPEAFWTKQFFKECNGSGFGFFEEFSGCGSGTAAHVQVQTVENVLDPVLERFGFYDLFEKCFGYGSGTIF